jgi:hypothetical protein
LHDCDGGNIYTPILRFAQASDGVDVALLSSLLYPQSLLLEPDEAWDPENLVQYARALAWLWVLVWFAHVALVIHSTFQQ